MSKSIITELRTHIEPSNNTPAMYLNVTGYFMLLYHSLLKIVLASFAWSGEPSKALTALTMILICSPLVFLYKVADKLLINMYTLYISYGMWMFSSQF